MVVEPTLVSPPETLWRVGRIGSPLGFSTISPEDAANPRGGNRFDVPGGGVLYAATEPSGAFAETLARFRPTAEVRKRVSREAGEHHMEVGAVPAEWRTRRVLTRFSLDDPLPFIDVDTPATHTYLTDAMARELEALGVRNLDVATVRGNSRFLTREIAKWAFIATDEDGEYCYSGLRYGSRLGNFECWAIFAGTLIGDSDALSIQKTDSSLLATARSFGLSIH